MAIKEEDLSLLSLQRLQHLNDELDRISVEASGVLTHALMTREKEGQDKEVYNGMIQVRFRLSPSLPCVLRCSVTSY